MTQIQIKVLHEIYKKPMETISFMEWLVEGFREKDLIFLKDNGYVNIFIGDGWVGGLRMMELTDKGRDLIKDYCDVCECMPCDCDWGQQ